MTLDSDLGINNRDREVSIWTTQEHAEPLAESAERVDACRGAIFSSNQARTAAVFFLGVIVGDMGGVILTELTAPQRIHSLAPIWFALAAFFAAVSLSVYRICIVKGCCSKKTEAH